MPEHLPLVSIVIATYNCAPYLAEAIESVLAQTFSDYEIIIVDDGSTDDTAAVLASFGDRIQVHAQRNQGVAAARNVGVAFAKGSLIAFLDADDIFFPQKLEKQVALFKQSSSLAMVISGWQIVTCSGEVMSQAQPWKDRPRLDLETAVLYKPARPSATMMRRAWFTRLNGFDSTLSSAEDLDFLLRAIASGAEAAWLPEVLVSYRQHTNSLMTQGQALVNNTDTVMEHFFSRPDLPPEIRRLEQQERYQSLCWLAARMYFEGHLSAMETCLSRALMFASAERATTLFDWLRIFQGYADEYGHRLDTYALTSCTPWRSATQLALVPWQLEHQIIELDKTEESLTSAAEAANHHHPSISKGNSTHVLLYSDDPGAGGILQCNHAIICHLAALGYETSHVHFVQETPIDQQASQLGVSAIDLEYHADSDFTRSLKDLAGAKKLFLQHKPDLIIFSDGWPFSNVAAKQAAAVLGIPYIIVLGFIEPSCIKYSYGDGISYRALATLQYARAQSVIAVSQQNLALLRQLFELPDKAGQVIYNGRPRTYFEPPSNVDRVRLRQELNIPLEAVVCFTSGRLESVKGYQYQLEAIRQLKALPTWEDLYFVWAGIGEQHLSRSNESALKATAKEIGVTERVKFLGQRWDIPAWLNAADIFVLPSEAEGMPLSIMEAMAKGLPVVASAVSGIPEELGETGALLPDPNNDSEATISQLVQIINRWAASPKLRQQIGQQCKLRATEMFQQKAMVQQYARTVEQVLGSGPATNSSKPSKPNLADLKLQQWTEQKVQEIESQFYYVSLIWLSWRWYIQRDFVRMDKSLKQALALRTQAAGWPILEWGQYFLRFSKEKDIALDTSQLFRSQVWQRLLDSNPGKLSISLSGLSWHRQAE